MSKSLDIPSRKVVLHIYTRATGVALCAQRPKNEKPFVICIRNKEVKPETISVTLFVVLPGKKATGMKVVTVERVFGG